MDIKSPFNACMHREYCQSEIDRLRAEILYLQKEKASLKEERDALRRKVYTNTDNGVTMDGRIFSADGDGYIQDNNFDYDAGMELSGDFGGADIKQQYAQMICDTLNSHCTLTQQLAAANGKVEMLRDVLTGLRNYALKFVCYHDETHRGGLIWEICDLCGKKWADDEGGKPEFKEPKEISKANAALSNLNEDSAG